MPDTAAEAGVSAMPPYRYFASKEEIILAIATDAFRLVFDPVEQLAAVCDAPCVARFGPGCPLAHQGVGVELPRRWNRAHDSSMTGRQVAFHSMCEQVSGSPATSEQNQGDLNP